MKLSDPYLLGPLFGQNGKHNITIKHLLLHNSGLPAGPSPIYSDKSFGCPESFKPRPKLSFTCLNKIYDSILKQKIVRPVGSSTEYSDLSMIILSYAIGKISKELNLIDKSQLRDECKNQFRESEPGLYMCYYDAFVKVKILDYYGMDETKYIPDESTWGLIAPAWNETGFFRNDIIQGEVSDENAFALGGISGNAGLFSTSHDLFKLTYYLMFNEENHLNKTTTELFTNVYDYEKSSRALGWDTNHYILNTHRGCGNFSESTFTHTGYTGTQICADKERGIITILLTNRCYPDKTRTSEGVKYLRRNFSNAVKDIIDNQT